MNTINYKHSENLHILDAPSVIFPIVNNKYKPKSILDVGCGLGTWLKIASSCGIEDFLGIDGIEVADEQFLVSKQKFRQYDFTSNWNIQRKFDLVICLEVAEHLPIESADKFIQSLTLHSDIILFSAAYLHQGGQGHINCQCPTYWQKIFNKYGYVCADEIRPVIWDKEFPEFWYKQNIFVAKRDMQNAGHESIISSIVHPDMYENYYQINLKQAELIEQILNGNYNFKIYLTMFLKAVGNRINRKFGSFFGK